MDENRDQDRIEKLKDSLYQLKPVRRTDARRVIHEKEYDVKTSFDIDPTESSQDTDARNERNISFTIFIVALICFIAAGIFAGYRLFFGSNDISGNAIDLHISAPSFVEGGETFPIDFSVSNQNQVELQFTELTIEYPKGESTAAEESKTTITKNLATVAPGKLIQDSVNGVLFGTEGSERTITAKLSYSIPGSTAIFEKTTSVTVALKSSPISVTTDALQEVSANQEVTMKVNVAALRGKDVANMVVHAEYPNGFQFTTSDPKPVAGNNTWSLGTVAAGQTKTITIKGVVRGEDGDERTVRISSGVSTSNEHNSVDVVLDESKIVYAVQKPFLSVDIAVNDTVADEHPIRPGEIVKVVLTWKNNLARKIQNAEFVANLSGSLIDKSSVAPVLGYYDSRNNSISWTRLTNAEFTSIEPGATGKLEFQFKTNMLGGGAYSQNIQIAVGVKGRRVSEQNVTEELASSQQTILKPVSSSKLAITTLYSAGPFANSGPIPPIAESETTYTIGFEISNTSNVLKNGAVRFKLPLYARLLESSQVDSGGINYDPTSREVYWNVGAIPAGAGTDTASIHGYVQVAVTPSVTNVGKPLTIVPSVLYTAIDAVTGTQINQTTNNAVTTRLVGDSSFVPGQEIVQQAK